MNKRRTCCVQDAKAVRLSQYFFENRKMKNISVLLHFCCPILYRTIRIPFGSKCTTFSIVACFYYQKPRSHRQVWCAIHCLVILRNFGSFFSFFFFSMFLQCSILLSVCVCVYVCVCVCVCMRVCIYVCVCVCV